MSTREIYVIDLRDMVSSFHTFASSVPAPSDPGGRIRRGYYPRSQLTQALKAVVTGRMTVRQAAEHYKIPRPTLQKRYAKVRDEHIRAEQMTSQMNISSPGVEYDDSRENPSTSDDIFCLDDQQPDLVSGNVTNDAEIGSLSQYQPGLAINYEDHNYAENYSGNNRQSLAGNRSIPQRRPIYTTVGRHEESSTPSIDDNSLDSNNVLFMSSEQFYQEVAAINSRLPASSQLPRNVQTIIVKDTSGNLVRKIMLQHMPTTHDSENRC